jgi:hypothetical protein
MKRREKLILALFALVIIGCSALSSPIHRLEGTWRCSGSMDEFHAWYLEYKFTGNNYEMQGYPPISESGTMHLKESKGDSLLVEFRVTRSEPEYKNHSEWIYLKGDEFILNSNTFSRSIDQKK